ncbi:MAG TPA: carnitine dehydratase, partial [Streptosporangiaceae bacterium]|nr:carnitine dehydratase [Streptosporangiaceae bacterium]
MANELGDLCPRVWRSIGGTADVAEVLTVTGPPAVLPAYFDVTGLATASVACATLAAAEFLAAREVSRLRPVSVDS